MIDINSLDFRESFDLKDATVGIIGQGFVGGAMRAFFERKVRTVTYDKFRPDLCTDGSSPEKALDKVVGESELIFVCVPTPMRRDGSCHTKIVESVLDDIESTALRIGRPADTFIVCVKSTVWPGFTEEQKKLRPSLRLTFSPEFLTEKNAVDDMVNAARVVVGGSEEDSMVVLKYFLEVDKRRVDEGKCVLVQCEPTTAELVKLFTNGMLFAKVLFANEMFKLCEKLEVKYDDVRFISAIDPRIGRSHMAVPGHDGDFGAGGHCFPKDMHNLKFMADKLGTHERLFTAVLQRNEELRSNKDWLAMTDRAVVDE